MNYQPTGKVQDPSDPKRCQAMMRTGLCMNIAVEGGTVCGVHGGNSQAQSLEKDKIRNYRLTKFQADVERHTDSSQLKSLRQEVGILRLTLEKILNHCESDVDLLLQSAKISDMVTAIDKLVNSCHKLETNLGQVLDKQQLLQFASEIIGIIVEEIPDAVAVDRIASRIMTTMTKEATTP